MIGCNYSRRQASEMSDCVFDTSFVATANGSLTGEKKGTLLHRRLTEIRKVVDRENRVRYNPKLLTEYMTVVKKRRNDVVDQFFELLDSDRAVRLKTNTLRHADKTKANDCRWPTHDQHVLAAAIGGTEVSIHVTENALGACAAAIKRVFGFKVNHVA